jgi:Flp pilus assembly protein TadG
MLPARPIFERKFRSDTNGSIIVTFALVAGLLLGMVGFAADFSRATSHKNAMQTSLDAALLAAATRKAGDETTGEETLKSLIEDYFKSNFAKRIGDAQGHGTIKLEVDLSDAGRIEATATYDMPNYFLQLVGDSDVRITAAATARFGISQTDIVLALDNTLSMSGAKIDGLRTATEKLIDKVYDNPGAVGKVRIGIVPFAQYVNVGTKYAGASWLGDTTLWSRDSNYCVDAVRPIYGTPCQTVTEVRYNDGIPYDYSYEACPVIGQETVPVCTSFTEISRWDGCVGSRNAPLHLVDEVASGQVVPPLMQSYMKEPDRAEYPVGTTVHCNSPLTRLTDSRTELDTAIAQLTAVGETYTPAGLLWGWRLLSDKPPFADGERIRNGVPVRRVLILMSDGANTRSRDSDTNAWHEGTSAADANAITTSLCSKLKGDDIDVFVVSFALDETEANNLLRTCASDPGNFYKADTVSDLIDSFTKIGGAIANVQLTH